MNLEEIFCEGEWRVRAARLCAADSVFLNLAWRLEHVPSRAQSEMCLTPMSSFQPARAILRRMRGCRGAGTGSVLLENSSQDVDAACRIAQSMEAFWAERGRAQAAESRRRAYLQKALQSLRSQARECLELGASSSDLCDAVREAADEDVHEA